MLSTANLPSLSHLPGQRRFVRYIGLYHFAHLRAVAEGLKVVGLFKAA